MPEAFLGSGLSFPIAPDGQGRLPRASQEESVRQAVWIILATARGERRMRPDFGCGIHDLVFAPLTPATAGRVAQEVREALAVWEPRIDVEDVAVSADTDMAALNIEVSYRVRATNSPDNLVYPLYLSGGSRP